MGFPIPEDSQVKQTKVLEIKPGDSMDVMTQKLSTWTTGMARQVRKIEALRSDLHEKLKSAKRDLQQATDLETDEPPSPSAKRFKRKRASK